MFNTSFACEIKSDLSVRRSKIPEYGKRGEFNSKKWRTRVFTYLPHKTQRYVRISSLRVEWVPTVSHLLDAVDISLKLSDTRASRSSSQGMSTALAFIKRPANKPWTMELGLGISIPTSEIKNGLPLSFDIEIKNARIKEESEMGNLSFSFSLTSSKFAEESEIGPISFSTDQEDKSSSECVLWRGMPTRAGEKKEDASTKLVCSYLRGEMSLSVLAEKMKALVLS